MDAEERPADPDNMKEQHFSAKNEKSISTGFSQDAGTNVHPIGQLGSLGPSGYQSVYSPNIYAPQPQPFYYQGYENARDESDEYPTYMNTDGLELGSPGIYTENPSLVYHTGYGYNPQGTYGPYSPTTTPLPSPGGDAQLYSPWQFPFSGTPYCQQLVNPSMAYEFPSMVNVNQQSDNVHFGPRPGYPQLGSFGGDNFPRNHGNLGFHDLHQGFDHGSRSGGLWSNWTNPSDSQKAFTPIPPAVSPQPVNTIGSFGPYPEMASRHQRYPHGFESGSNRVHWQSDFNQGGSFEDTSIPNSGLNGRGWFSLDSSKHRGALCGCNVTFDILNEKNRGPRAFKSKSQVSPIHGSVVDNSDRIKSTVKTVDNLYNSPDFVTEYKDAKFFVIKSYSEDNIHKSIKYDIWASTPSGNKRLDSSFSDAKDKEEDNCPVFLFFSVNASAQFCGVAEMVGPVDFDKSVDYWQQDKWSGQFPVKWHIIKDVPNSKFRHIVLENNDNKPVTNSRDTQEVKLEQGIEMLQIFKSYETKTSILDDFDFYENRQKDMEERKARQQDSLAAVGVIGENDHRTVLSNDFMKKFGQVVNTSRVSGVGCMWGRC